MCYLFLSLTSWFLPAFEHRFLFSYLWNSQYLTFPRKKVLDTVESSGLYRQKALDLSLNSTTFKLCRSGKLINF